MSSPMWTQNLRLPNSVFTGRANQGSVQVESLYKRSVCQTDSRVLLLYQEILHPFSGSSEIHFQCTSVMLPPGQV